MEHKNTRDISRHLTGLRVTVTMILTKITRSGKNSHGYHMACPSAFLLYENAIQTAVSLIILDQLQTVSLILQILQRVYSGILISPSVHRCRYQWTVKMSQLRAVGGKADCRLQTNLLLFLHTLLYHRVFIKAYSSIVKTINVFIEQGKWGVTLF